MDQSYCEPDGTIGAYNCAKYEQCDECFMKDHLKECDYCKHYDHPDTKKEQIDLYNTKEDALRG